MQPQKAKLFNFARFGRSENSQGNGSCRNSLSNLTLMAETEAFDNLSDQTADQQKLIGTCFVIASTGQKKLFGKIYNTMRITTLIVLKTCDTK